MKLECLDMFFSLTEVNTSILNKYLKFIWSVHYQLLNCFCSQQIVSNLLPLIVCMSVNFMAQVWGVVCNK